MSRLSGRIALVTGGSNGIGAATAELFAAEGAEVGLLDVTDGSEVVASIVAAGGRVVAHTCDVADPSAVAEAVGRLVSELGPVDVLFNNAGMESGDGPTHEIDPSDLERIMQVNVHGMFNTCRAVLPGMIARAHGSIVNVSSVGGLVGNADHHAYAASKGAVIAHTRALAVGYGPNGIRANTICPGPTRTTMSSRLGPEWERQRAAAVPLGRMADPIEIAHAALFLASDDASFVSGAVLTVDGGRTAK